MTTHCGVTAQKAIMMERTHRKFRSDESREISRYGSRRSQGCKKPTNNDGSFLCFRYGASTIEEAVKKTQNVTPDDMLTLQLSVNDAGTREDSCL
jgi:hypothetical protein